MTADAEAGTETAASFSAKKTVIELTDASEQSAEIGFEPTAVIAWWAPRGHNGTASGNAGGMGLWTREVTGSVAWISEDDQPAARVGHVVDTAALVGLGRGDSGMTMRAELESWNTTGLSLRFTTPPSEPWTVHLLALGGRSVRALVGDAAANDSPQIGIELGGLRPDLLLFVPATGDATPQALGVGIGAATGRRQAAAGYSIAHDSRPGTVAGAQRGDAAVVVPPGRWSVTDEAALGISLEQRGDVRGWPRVLYLAVEGVRAAVGTDVSPRTPASAATKVGFRPEALLTFSWGLSADSKSRGIGRLCLGGAAADASGCAGWDDRNVEAERTSTHALSSTERLLVVADTRTGGVHAEAALKSIDDGGFTLEWARSDGVAREFAYVALAADLPAPRKPSRGVRSRLGRFDRPF